MKSWRRSATVDLLISFRVKGWKFQSVHARDSTFERAGQPGWFYTGLHDPENRYNVSFFLHFGANHCVLYQGRQTDSERSITYRRIKLVTLLRCDNLSDRKLGLITPVGLSQKSPGDRRLRTRGGCGEVVDTGLVQRFRKADFAFFLKMRFCGI